MGNGEHATTLELWDRLQGYDHEEPHTWLSFATEFEAIKTMKICFTDFKICHIPRAQNGIADSLVKIAKSFHRTLCYIGCCIVL